MRRFNFEKQLELIQGVSSLYFDKSLKTPSFNSKSYDDLLHDVETSAYFLKIPEDLLEQLPTDKEDKLIKALYHNKKLASIKFAHISATIANRLTHYIPPQIKMLHLPIISPEVAHTIAAHLPNTNIKLLALGKNLHDSALILTRHVKSNPKITRLNLSSTPENTIKFIYDELQPVLRENLTIRSATFSDKWKGKFDELQKKSDPTVLQDSSLTSSISISSTMTTPEPHSVTNDAREITALTHLQAISEKQSTPVIQNQITNMHPVAGIDPKYTHQERLPNISLSVNTNQNNDDTANKKFFYNHLIKLNPIKLQASRFYQTHNVLAGTPLRLQKDDLFVFDYYSKSSSSSSEDTRVASFIFAGRGINALIPNPGYSHRVILIISEKQLTELKDSLPSDIEIIVIKKLQSETHGKFTDEQLGLISARRLAAFLCAYELGLDYFLVFDDNIKEINFNIAYKEAQDDWSALHQFFQQQLMRYNAVSCSLQSQSGISTSQALSNKLGCKIFYYDLKTIKEILNQPQHYFYLQPPAACANWPLEDYFLQLVLMTIFEGAGKLGHYTLPMEAGRITRSLNHKNSCKKVILKIEESYSSSRTMLHSIDHSVADPNLVKYFEKAYNHLLRIISTNIKHQDKKRHRLAEMDLSTLQSRLSVHSSESESVSSSSCVDEIDIEDEPSVKPTSVSSDEDSSYPFKKSKLIHKLDSSHDMALETINLREDISVAEASLAESTMAVENFWDHINQRADTLISSLESNYQALTLRRPQIENIKCVLQSPCQPAYSELSPGVGKTMIQFVLCDLILAIQAKLENQKPIFVVIPNLSLVNQAYSDFEKYQAKTKRHLKLLKISSEDDSVPITIMKLNSTWKSKNQVIIICLASFMLYLKYIEEKNQTLTEPSLLLLDELHLVGTPQAEKIVFHAKHSKIPVFAYTATMLDSHKSFFMPLHQFSRDASMQAKITAPLVVEKMEPFASQAMIATTFTADNECSKFELDPITDAELIETLIKERVAEVTAQRLEEILLTLQYKVHPNGKPLTQYKGIIFANSIEEADAIQKFLVKNKLNAIAKHSKTKKSTAYKKADIIIAVDMLKSGHDDNKIYWVWSLQKGKKAHDVAQMAGRLYRLDLDNPHKIGYFMVTDMADITHLKIPAMVDDRSTPKLFSRKKFRSLIFSDTPDIMDIIIRNHAEYLKELYQRHPADTNFLIGQYHLFSYDSKKITEKVLKVLCSQLNLSHGPLTSNQVTSDYIDLESKTPIRNLFSVNKVVATECTSETFSTQPQGRR